MEYTVSALAKLAGVTPRTLRWYDRLGLLKPARTTPAGYRLYGQREVDRLQQILFYRELGFPLASIASILDAPGFDRQAALQSHLTALTQRRDRLDALILTVQKTLMEAKGDIPMTDEEKFAAFKRQLVEENEARYGREVRAAYGDQAADEANAAALSLTPTQYRQWKELDATLRTALAAAVRAGEDPAGPEGQRISALHARWLSLMDPGYTPQKHAGIAQLYVLDERFTAYYDSEVPGCAQFLTDAVQFYTNQQ